jgi:hypothetical protein
MSVDDEGEGRRGTHPTSLRASQLKGFSKLKLDLAEISKYWRFLEVDRCQVRIRGPEKGGGLTSFGGR